nr:hypothetical protein [Tanacetum cinerariifolium]
MAFVSSSSNNNINSSNEALNVAFGVTTAGTQVNAANSTNIDNMSDAIICAFLESQLEQIHPDDLEEIDLKWQMAMLTMRAKRFLKNTRRKLNLNGNKTVAFDKTKVEFYNYHKRGHFAREYLEVMIGVTNLKKDLTMHLWHTPLQIADKSKACLGYNVVPPPYTGNVFPLKPNLSGLEEFVNDPIVSETTVKKLVVETSEVKASEDMPQVGNPQIDLKEKRMIDTGCSRHMIGNMSYLTDYEEIDEGYFAFGGNLKGGKITDKGTKDNNNAGQARKEKEPGKDYIFLSLWTANPPFPQEPKSSQGVRSNLLMMLERRLMKSQDKKMNATLKRRRTVLTALTELMLLVQLLMLLAMKLMLLKMHFIDCIKPQEHGMKPSQHTCWTMGFKEERLIRPFSSEGTKCKKQTVVANSTTKAEYVVASSYCGQFWTTAKSKIVNGKVQIHALVDSMKRIVNGFSGKETPLFPTMMGPNQVQMGKVSAQPTHTQHTPTFDMSPPKPKRPKNLGNPREKLLRATTTTSSLEAEQDIGNIDKTQTKATSNEPSSQRTSSCNGLRRQETIRDTSAHTRKVKKLEKKHMSRTHKLKRLYKVGLTTKKGIKDVGVEEVVKVVTTAKMIVDAAQVTTAIVGIPVSVAETIVTTAPTITGESTKINVELQLTDAEKAKLFIEFIKKRRKFFAVKRYEEMQNKPPTKAQQKSIMSTYLKNMDGWKIRSLKKKSFAEIQELFDKAMKRINTFVDSRTELVKESSKKDEAETAQESNSKRAGTELEQENAKKQKMQDDKEFADLKKCLEIIRDDVTIDATPLSSKSPTIVDWKIYKEWKKSYYQIIRVGEKSKNYLIFSHMLKDFDREDVEIM